MPSRLSSLLVRDGLVGVKRMEKAFQRQVIYGGSLDTILLEMTLVPEDRLTQYLALASGLPPAARDEGRDIAPEATAAISQALAEKHRAIPLAVAGEAIRILVCSPLELDDLEDLADLLDRPLQPLITPEYRWHLVFASAYNLETPVRFTTLARALDTDAPTPPVGRGQAVIVDERASRSTTKPPPAGSLVAVDVDLDEADPSEPGAPEPSPLAPIAATDETLKVVTGDLVAAAATTTATAASPERGERHRTATLVGVQPNRASTETGAGTSSSRLPAVAGTPTGRRDGMPDEPLPPPIVTFSPLAAAAAAMASTPARRVGPQPASRPIKRIETEPIDTLNRDSPLPVVRARELLATVGDRDTLFLTLLRAARSRARYAALLTVQGGAAIGRVALAESGIDVTSINTVLLPLDVMSPFRAVVTSHQPHVGPIAAGDPQIDMMLRRFGGTLPPSALVMPIILRDRAVAIVVAHRMHNDIKLVDVTELLPLASATSDALGRLIVKQKTVNRAPTDPDPAPDGPIDQETTRIDTRDGSGPRRRPGSDTEVDLPAISLVEHTDVAFTAEPPRPIDEVILAIERAPEGAAGDLIQEAVERAVETLGALMRNFPGRLRVDRFAVSGRPLRAAQYGGLLELVIQLGSVAAELLIEKMSAPQRDVRFYATVCAAELRPRSAVYALVERVFDQDFGVRAMAIEALAGYPMHDLANALSRARRAVYSDDPEVVLAATSAIISLGDIDAIGELIGVVEKPGRGGDHARKALSALTAQDWGPSEKKWRKWWEGAKGKHRVEWLIDGLNHKDDVIREAAIADLRRLTGEYFGYHHDLPKKERDSSAARWATWWREAGQRRFVTREDERNRPTGLMAARKPPE